MDIRVTGASGDDLHAVFMDTEGTLRLIPFATITMGFVNNEHHITVGNRTHVISGGLSILPKDAAYMKYVELSSVISHKAAVDAAKKESL